MRRMINLMVLMGMAFTVCAAEELAPMFPFVISYDGPDNASSVAHFLEAPAGKHGFIRVKDDHFVTDAGPIRFHATNLTGPANFPSHADADKLAERLARFGINCVRLHYMDALYGNFMTNKVPGIFGGDPRTHRTLDPQRMDCLDYLVAALKKRGVYVDINLLVARPLRDTASQKAYARELLTHVNSYTGLAYTDDPCVAFIEIKNENGLVYSYYRGHLDNPSQGFRQQWNAWLAKRYLTSEALRQAWQWNVAPLSGEQIPEGSFKQPITMDGSKWIFALSWAKAACAVSNGVLRIDVASEGEVNFPQLYRRVAVKKDGLYTLSFKIRRVTGAGKKTVLGLAVADTRKGWRSAGLHREVHVGDDWQTVTCPFIATDDVPKAQIWLTRFKPGAYEIANFSFQSGAVARTDKVWKLEEGTVPFLKRSDFAPVQAQHDLYQFLIDTERAYWHEMTDCIKKELHAKPLVSGTQACHSPPFLQAELDYVDNHAYWCHPGGEGWLFPNSSEPWHIRNLSMVGSLGALLNMAGQRVHGQAYTVSEYNHPYPNQYGAESQPMLAVFGRFQGWSGIFQYSYNHYGDEFEPQANPWCFFDLLARPDALAHFPACAAIFLRGDVREAQETIAIAVGSDEFREAILRGGGSSFGLGALKLNPRLMAVHKVALDFSGNGLKPSDVPKGPSAKQAVMSDTGEIVWNTEKSDAAYLAVNTPNTKLFTGFPDDRRIDLGGVTLKVGKTRLNWTIVSLVSRYATGFGGQGAPANILLAATGDSGNSGRVIERLPGQRITLTDRGGAPVLAEGIPAEVTLPSEASKTRCYALDPHGERKSTVPVEKSVDGTRIMIGPQYQTVWYEIEIL